MTTRTATSLARARAALLILVGAGQALACSKVTTVPPPEFPMTVSAKPPAPPRPEWPTVPQPPPPRRVILDGELLTLDEALSFDERGQLAAEHADIVAELAKWLAEHGEIIELQIEVSVAGEGSKRTRTKRAKALAAQVVAALVGHGVAAERLVATTVEPSGEDQALVVLRAKQAEAAVGFEIEE